MKKVMIMLVAVMMVAACGLTKKSLGMAKATPDDGNMSRKERLVIPPEYDVRPNS